MLQHSTLSLIKVMPPSSWAPWNLVQELNDNSLTSSNQNLYMKLKKKIEYFALNFRGMNRSICFNFQNHLILASYVWIKSPQPILLQWLKMEQFLVTNTSKGFVITTWPLHILLSSLFIYKQCLCHTISQRVPWVVYHTYINNGVLLGSETSQW